MAWLFLLTISGGLIWLGRSCQRQDEVLGLAINSAGILAGIWGWLIAPMAVKCLLSLALLGWWQLRLSRLAPLKTMTFKASVGVD